MRFNSYYKIRVLFESIKKALLSFIFVWIGNAFLDLAAYVLFRYLFNVSYIISQIISYVASAGVRYIVYSNIKINRIREFKNVLIEFPRFISISFLTLMLSVVIIYFTRNILFINAIPSKIIVTVFTTSMNAFTYKKLIFTDLKYK